MLEIALTVCSLLNGQSCHDQSLTFDLDGQGPAIVAMICMSPAPQAEVAKWAAEHPNWSVTRYECREAGTVAKL